MWKGRTRENRGREREREREGGRERERGKGTDERREEVHESPCLAQVYLNDTFLNLNVHTTVH